MFGNALLVVVVVIVLSQRLYRALGVICQSYISTLEYDIPGTMCSSDRSANRLVSRSTCGHDRLIVRAVRIIVRIIVRFDGRPVGRSVGRSIGIGR